MKEDQNKAPVPMRIVIAFLYALMLAVNTMAQFGFINKVTTAALSDSYPNLFVPIGFTFSVWGVIYLSLLGYVLYQLGLFRKTESLADARLIQRTQFVFIVSSVANIVWIFAWHFRQTLVSVVVMLILLVSLCYMNSILNVAARKELLTFREKIFLRLPFSLYLGWITVATIANVSAFLVSIQWNRFGLSEVLWMVMILGIGTIIAMSVIILGRDPAYGLVVLWAYAGILIKHVMTTGFNLKYPEVVTTTIICMALLIIAELYILVFKKREDKKSKGIKDAA